MKSSKLSKKEFIDSLKAYSEARGFDVLSKKDTSDLVDVFSDAFYNDPMVNYVGYIQDTASDKEKCKKDLLKFMFGWMTTDIVKQKYGMGLGVKQNGILVGGILVVPSGCDERESVFTVIRRLFQTGFPPTENKKDFHPFASKRLNQLTDIVTRRLQLLKELGHKRYIYIQTVGVKTTEQGKGIGKKLLQLISDAGTSLNAPVFLETESKENESMYIHLGFRTLEELTVKVPDDKGSLVMYLMIKGA